MLYYFCYIMHFHCLLQEFHHIWYRSTFLGLLGGIYVISFVVLPGTVIIVEFFFLQQYFSFRSGNTPYPLNCGKYLGIALKLIVRSTTGTLE